MLSRLGFRYRIYPTLEQEARLLDWEDALRALWNAANEQRLEYLKRHASMPSAFDQSNQLKDLRADLPWQADLPRHSADKLLVDLDAAWQRCFMKLGRKPRWKKKGRGAISITEPYSKGFRLTATGVVFPKLGEIRAVFHRPIQGIQKICTISREVNQWFVSIQCEQEPDRRTGPVVAIDRGITNLLADSDGAVIKNPKYLEGAIKRLARAQRVVARREKGSRRRERAKFKVAVLHRKVRRRRQHTLHVLSSNYAKSHGVVVLERLNVKGMVRSNLGRQISDAGWSTFRSMLRYKLEATGGTLVEIPAHYSSQTCMACGVVNAANRSGEVFSCVTCGYTAHADLNAAQVLLSRRNGGGAGRGGFPEVRGPAKRQLRVVRRGRSTRQFGLPKSPDFKVG